MATEVILPKVDMDMATGRISRWLVAEGAAVRQGDPLFEIETDKAAMEIEAPASGLLRSRAQEGSDIPVGNPVAWIVAEGEVFIGGHTYNPLTSVDAVPPSLEAAVVTAVSTAPMSAGEGVRATPLARRVAREAGVDLASLQGTGPHGRISRVDVEDAVAARDAKPIAMARPMPTGGGDQAVRRLFADGSFRELAHDKMRLTIARRLVEAKSTIPHFYLRADCCLDVLLKLRADLNAVSSSYKLSINDIIVKAWALALRDFPMANVTWTDDTLLVHESVDVGVAVSIDGGLITPIVRNAEKKSLSVISNEIKDLAARAKARKLKAEDYQGGTTAISNLGMFGVKEFDAIINPPHATILAVGAGEQRGVWEKGNFVPATLMTVTLSVDHRAVDGALGAQVLRAFRSYVENPLAMLV